MRDIKWTPKSRSILKLNLYGFSFFPDSGYREYSTAYISYSSWWKLCIWPIWTWVWFTFLLFSVKVDSVLIPWIGNRKAWNPSICKYENFENYGSLKGNPWYHEFENKDVWKSMSGVKFTGESYRKYGYYFDFLEI